MSPSERTAAWHMARRSTRNKIKWQADKIQNQLDRVLVHLKAIDEFSEGKSDVINEWVPQLVKLFVGLKDTIARFQSEL